MPKSVNIDGFLSEESRQVKLTLVQNPELAKALQGAMNHTYDALLSHLHQICTRQYLYTKKNISPEAISLLQDYITDTMENQMHWPSEDTENPDQALIDWFWD